MSEKKAGKKSSGAPPSGGSSGAGGPMDVGLLEQIIRLMAANDLNTVDLRDGQRRVVLKRGPAAAPVMAGYAPMMTAPPAAAPPAAPQASGTPGGGGGGAGDESVDESKYIPVKADSVGTFYAAPKPGEKPFVAVGSIVTEETQVCVIEAMKNMLPQAAGCSGTVAKILVQNGQSVQFGQTLMLVKPG